MHDLQEGFMYKAHLNPGGGPVLDCASDNVCQVFSCEVCLKEIPADAALSEYVQDYVHHFCGLDCLESWQKRGPVRKQH
jgi:hypothetical protein